MDEGRAIDIVYLDFGKAFDTVSHKIFADQLLTYGLDGESVRWTENWLSGKAQRVEISSIWTSVSTSLPWG